MVEGTRRQARERALDLLYEAESKSERPNQVLDQLPIPPDRYTDALVRGVQEARERIDDLISRHAVDWSLDRMPAVDRALLRLATFELVERPELAVAVIITEAVELAKAYSTEPSARFVNGVLAAVAAEVRAGAC